MTMDRHSFVSQIFDDLPPQEHTQASCFTRATHDWMIRQPELALKYVEPYKILSLTFLNKEFDYSEDSIDELHFKCKSQDFLCAIAQSYSNNKRYPDFDANELKAKLLAAPSQLREIEDDVEDTTSNNFISYTTFMSPLIMHVAPKRDIAGNIIGASTSSTDTWKFPSSTYILPSPSGHSQSPLKPCEEIVVKEQPPVQKEQVVIKSQKQEQLETDVLTMIRTPCKLQHKDSCKCTFRKHLTRLPSLWINNQHSPFLRVVLSSLPKDVVCKDLQLNEQQVCHTADSTWPRHKSAVVITNDPRFILLGRHVFRYEHACHLRDCHEALLDGELVPPSTLILRLLNM